MVLEKSLFVLFILKKLADIQGGFGLQKLHCDDEGSNVLCRKQVLPSHFDFIDDVASKVNDHYHSKDSPLSTRTVRNFVIL
jgi:hypothetical protein